MLRLSWFGRIRSNHIMFFYQDNAHNYYFSKATISNGTGVTDICLRYISCKGIISQTIYVKENSRETWDQCSFFTGPFCKVEKNQIESFSMIPSM